MKEAYWGYWLVALGVFVVIIMLLIGNVTSNNTEDHYSVNQISEAAMVAAVDYAYYRDYGELKINKEKYMEVFLRMFVDSIEKPSDYKIVFTGMYEAPPKVSVEVVSDTDKYSVANDTTSFDMANRVDAILEQNK
jgi:hypothetical protein